VFIAFSVLLLVPVGAQNAFAVAGDFIDVFVSKESGGLFEPIKLVFGPDGNLYVSSFGTNQILKYDGNTGAFIDDFVSGLSGPLGLDFGPNGNLYVSSYFPTNEVLRYDGNTGAFIDVFVSAGSGGLNTPMGLDFGPNGNLYVSSYFTNEVLRYNGINGGFIDVFISAGSGGLSFPGKLVFGPDGNLYVSSPETDQVFRYNGNTGAFIDVFVSAGSGGLDGPLGLVFGPNGNFYVSSFENDRVLKYNGNTGAFIDDFVFPGSGGLDKPRGLIFGPDGNLYVSSGFPTNQVLRYEGYSSGGGCLIATATYGSELAPQVQMLREIRDNSLLQTQSGQSFMQGFNSFYYSFSPTIADYERQNPVFKEAIKIAITPLISSLSILNFVEIDSEFDVLGYGIGLIMLNVGMYFVVPVMVIHRIKKILNS